MTGYQVRLEDKETGKKEPFLFVEPDRWSRNIPFPPPLQAYVDFLRKKK